MGSISHVVTRDAVASLTFDDGPHSPTTPCLLGLLERYQARATFFMIGKAAQKYPELVRQVAQAGHVIGNHSWDHPHFRLISGSERREQIRLCERAITPHGQRFFRAPWGEQSLGMYFDALWLRYRVVNWNLDACDWIDDDAKNISDRVVSQIQPGSIILLHDGREHMLEAVNMFLERLHGSFRFITVPELLQHGRPVRR